MSNLLEKKLFVGFRSTPILVTLIIILGLCMALDYFVEPTDDVKLICHSNSYNLEYYGKQDRGLRFEIERINSDVKMHMVYLKNNKDVVTLSSEGQLLKVSAPVLTYEVQLDAAKLTRNLLDTNLSPHMQETVGILKKIISDDIISEGKAFHIKVLEMDKTTGFVTIQVSERNGLWACEIQ